MFENFHSFLLFGNYFSSSMRSKDAVSMRFDKTLHWKVSSLRYNKVSKQLESTQGFNSRTRLLFWQSKTGIEFLIALLSNRIVYTDLLIVEHKKWIYYFEDLKTDNLKAGGRNSMKREDFRHYSCTIRLILPKK